MMMMSAAVDISHWKLIFPETGNYHSFEKKDDDDDWEAWETGVRDETDHFIQFHFA